MKLYIIQVTGPHPARYRGLTGASDTEAIDKAKQRHRDAGFPVEGHEFKITNSYLIVCGSVREQAPDALHTVCLTDSQLAEIELALLDRTRTLEDMTDRAFKRGAVASARIHSVRLTHARAALSRVMAA